MSEIPTTPIHISSAAYSDRYLDINGGKDKNDLIAWTNDRTRTVGVNQLWYLLPTQPSTYHLIGLAPRDSGGKVYPQPKTTFVRAHKGQVEAPSEGATLRGNSGGSPDSFHLSYVEASKAWNIFTYDEDTPLYLTLPQEKLGTLIILSPKSNSPDQLWKFNPVVRPDLPKPGYDVADKIAALTRDNDTSQSVDKSEDANPVPGGGEKESASGGAKEASTSGGGEKESTSGGGEKEPTYEGAKEASTSGGGDKASTSGGGDKASASKRVEDVSASGGEDRVSQCPCMVFYRRAPCGCPILQTNQ